MSDVAKETADFWKSRLTKLHRSSQREKRDFDRLKSRMRDWEDLRDDIVSIALNSGKSEEQIEAEGGPVVKTQRNYKLHITRKAQLPTAMAYLRSCGKELCFRDITPGITRSDTSKGKRRSYKRGK